MATREKSPKHDESMIYIPVEKIPIVLASRNRQQQTEIFDDIKNIDNRYILALIHRIGDFA